jgi:hypothetical protein
VTRPSRDAVLDWLRREVPPYVAAELGGKRDSCVLSTRVGYDVCRYFGVQAKPTVVRAFAFNEAWARVADEQPELLADPDDAKWEDARMEGAWALAIDEEDHGTPGRFAGHLVLVAAGEPDWFLDLTAGQFSRPERGLTIPDAIWTVAPAGFVGGHEPLLIEGDGGAIAYLHRPGVSTFYRGGDWRKHQPLSGALIRRAKKELT